jgi:hypothetical protein
VATKPRSNNKGTHHTHPRLFLFIFHVVNNPNNPNNPLPSPFSVHFRTPELPERVPRR